MKKISLVFAIVAMVSSVAFAGNVKGKKNAVKQTSPTSTSVMPKKESKKETPQKINSTVKPLF